MKKLILTYGAIGGLIFGVNSYLQLSGTITMSWTANLIIFGVLFIIFTISGLALRKQQKGFASFGELIKLFIGISILVSVISMATSMVYISTLSEEKKTEMIDNQIEMQANMYKGMGFSEEQIAGLEDEMYKQAENMFSISTMLLGMIIAFFGYFIISLIPAAILKKNRPIEG